LGRPFLIEDFGESIASILDPIIHKKYETINNVKMIKMGEEIV